LFNGLGRWLGVQVGGDAEPAPRQRVANVEYAMRTGGDGDWAISDDDLYAAFPGNVGIGTTNLYFPFWENGGLTFQGWEGTSFLLCEDRGLLEKKSLAFWGATLGHAFFSRFLLAYVCPY
jgi:hypothetical protein